MCWTMYSSSTESGMRNDSLFWIEVFLLQVVAVVTVQVADGTHRFDKHLKFAGSFHHGSIPHLRGEFPETPDGIRSGFFWSDYKWDNPRGSRLPGGLTDIGSHGRVSMKRAGGRMKLVQKDELGCEEAKLRRLPTVSSCPSKIGFWPRSRRGYKKSRSMLPAAPQRTQFLAL